MTACTVITEDEVGALVGAPVTTAPTGDDTACLFQGSRGTVTVVFAPGGADDLWKTIQHEAAREILLDGGVTAVRIPELPMFVLRKNTTFVMMSATGDTTIADDRVDAVMKSVAARLP
jgi:hypothetical protein